MSKWKKPKDCIVCGKLTHTRIWVGGITEKGTYIENPICSDICFKKACALFLPSEEGRQNAKKALAEMGIEL